MFNYCPSAERRRIYFELGAKYACRKANLLREIRLLLAYLG